MENTRSTGIVVKFGQFRFLDVADFSGQPQYNLACPKGLIGPIDVYLVAHRGDKDNADPAISAAIEPRVAVENHGLKKGGSRETYELLLHVAGLEDVWQLHWSEKAGEKNFAAERIANLVEVRLTGSSSAPQRAASQAGSGHLRAWRPPLRLNVQRIVGPAR